MLFFVRFWILLSALLCGAGWILSAFHALSPIGYAVVFLVAGMSGVWWQRKTRCYPWEKIKLTWHKLRRRFKRPTPLAFLVLVCLAVGTGMLYPPTPGDESQYRTPRVLHWLEGGGVALDPDIRHPDEHRQLRI